MPSFQRHNGHFLTRRRLEWHSLRWVYCFRCQIIRRQNFNQRQFRFNAQSEQWPKRRSNQFFMFNRKTVLLKKGRNWKTLCVDRNCSNWANKRNRGRKNGRNSHFWDFKSRTILKRLRKLNAIKRVSRNCYSPNG